MLPKTVLKWLTRGPDRHASIAWIDSARAFRLFLRAGRWEVERFLIEVQLDHVRAGVDLVGLVFEQMSQAIDAAAARNNVERKPIQRSLTYETISSLV